MAVIDHVVVLVLENRSFDHLLGALDHPDPDFDGLSSGGPHANPGWDGDAPVIATPGAKPVLPVGPDHAHDAVMAQLGITAARPPWRPTNAGFVIDYERTCRRQALGERYAGLFAPFRGWVASRTAPTEPVISGRGPLVMLAQPTANVPVLSSLATEFAVCTRWFSSVPGETWPNRNFLHAASSDGEVNIDTRFYDNPTIFEVLERAGRTWRIYHDDTPQVWAFAQLWDTEDRHANWFAFSEFAKHAAAGDLPSYSFIEPNHRPPFHTLDHDPFVGTPDVSDNQHPENNLVSNEAYDTFAEADTDFARGERLIANVYEALRGSPELFARTLLLVTYDEHGGFFDHVTPAVGVANPHTRPSLATRIAHVFLRRRSSGFDFTMLGVRVPAVVISPLVAAGTIDGRLHDHASVPATLRALFAPTAAPLTSRDREATPFHDVATLGEPRSALPDLSRFAKPSAGLDAGTPRPAGTGSVPAYYNPFVELADRVHGRLVSVHEAEATAAPALPADPAQRAAEVSRVFAEAADRHRADRATED